MSERPEVDLVAAGLVPPLPAALLDGRDLDLLAPLGLAGDGAPAAGEPPAVDRRELAAALAVANAGYGHPAAERAAARLADPATRVVVTGQQPGLFGGPLYTLSKAVAAAKWAERLEAAGESAVAVFWVATEDHDYREVARSVFLTAEGPELFELGDDPEPLVPVGMRSLGPAVGELLERLAAAAPGDRWAGWVEQLGRWYRPDARFGEAFCRLLAHLLGERCPLLLDAMLPAVKAAERPHLRRLVEERAGLEAAQAARAEAIAERGYELQIRPQPGASPLFLLRGSSRRRIEWRGQGRFGLRGDDGFEQDVAWLLDAIEDNPGVVSPGVNARAAIQDAILGSSVVVLGPGEMSYLPQVAPVHEALGATRGRLAMRPQGLVLGGHQLDKLAGLEIGLAELVAPELDLDRALAGGRERDLVSPTRRAVAAALDELKTASVALDPSLAGPWKKTRGQVDKALGIFTGKVAAAVARQSEIARQRAEDLRAACRPLGALQERVVSTAHFPGKYGERLVAAYFEQLELEPRRLQVIRP